MPIYEYEGQRYDISDTDPDVAKNKILGYLASQEEPIPAYTPTPETGFIPSVKRGALGIQSLLADVAPAMAGRVGEKLGVPGSKEYADRQMAEAAAEQQRIQQRYPSAVPSYTDIKSGGDLLTYVTESIGELIPSMIPSILTGGAAGIAGRGAVIAAEQAAKKASLDAAQKTMLSYAGSKLSQDELVNIAKTEAIKAGKDAANKVALMYQATGAVAGSAAQNIPEVYQNVAQETGKEDLGAALLFGGFNSVLDAITPLALMRKAKGIGLTDKELIGAWYKRGAKGLGTGFLTEGGTEAVQEMSSAAAEKFVDNNKQFFSPENFERFINAGLKGGIGGGAVSGASNVLFGQKEPSAIKPTEGAEPTAAGETTPPIEPIAPTLSKEDALAQVAAAGKKPEEISDVIQKPIAEASGIGATVPIEPRLLPPPSGTTTSGPTGVADVAGAASVVAGGEGEQRSPLTSEVIKAEPPAAVVEEAKPATPVDFLDWVASKGYSLSDGSLDWPALQDQWKAESQQGAVKEPAAVVDAVAPVVEEPAAVVEGAAPLENIAKAAEDAQAAAPVSQPNLEEVTAPIVKELVTKEKVRQKGLPKTTETLEEKAKPFASVKQLLKEDPNAIKNLEELHKNTPKAPRTQAELNKKTQNLRMEQAKARYKIQGETTVNPADKENLIAVKNYELAADNNMDKALEFLAFDIATDSAKNRFKPGTGGIYAKQFYKTLTPEQKNTVDALVEKEKNYEKVITDAAIEKRNAKEAKAKTLKTNIGKQTSKEFKVKKDTIVKDLIDETSDGNEEARDFYETLTDKQKEVVDKEIKRQKQLPKGKKESGINKDFQKAFDDVISEIPENEFDEFINPKDYLAAVDEMFGGSTAGFRGHILHGDLRGAMREIVADTTGEFTALDKEIAKRLIGADTVPQVVVVDSLPGNAFGLYSNDNDTMYIAKNAINSHIVLHEAVHGYTVSLIRAWEKKQVANPGLESLSKLFKYLKANHPELATEYGIKKDDLAEFASEVMSNRDFQNKLKAIPYERTSFFTAFARAILKMFGIGENDKFTALASALISIDKAITPGRTFQETSEIIKPEVSEFAPKGNIKAPLRGIDSYDEWIKSMPAAAPPTNTQTIRKAFTTVEGAKELARLFQNERYPVKNWQDLLELAGKIKHAGNDQTNIYTQISLATGRAEDEFLVNMYNPSNELYKAIGEYATAKNVKEDVALKELQAIFVALHEGERRQAKYLMTVPLTADAAAQRKKILELVRSNQVDEDTARTLRTMLDDLVANNKMLGGFDDSGPSKLPLDINDDAYNVAGIRPAVIAETLAKQYEPNKALIQPIRDALQKVHQVTIDLNRRGNYWSQPVSNIVSFYGFKNYIPLKGKPGEVQSKVDDLLNFDSRYNGREMQEATYQFDGRISESENVLLQSLSDGVRAALRAGRGGTASDGTQFGITLAVKNAINSKLLGGRKLKTIKFEDRYQAEADDVLKAKGESTFFHYNPDGSIEIYEISDKRLREAIRRTYRTSQPLLDTANNITSFLGQMHTRYNVAFAPMNFIRDTLTNAFTMGAEMGPGVVGSIASKVAQGGLSRSMKVARLYKNGKFAEIEKLAAKDPYIKAMYEYIQLGGKVSYVSGIGSQSQFEQLQADIGRKGIATTKDQVDGVIDLWSNMFEFASRTAAYQVTKDRYMQEGMPENEAKVRAAGYVKNLANFEQTGVWGKQLGSLFMFFRPSATGAVRAIESLVPLFRDVDAAIANLPEVVRNDPEALAKFRDNMAKQKRAAATMLMSLAGAGATLYLMAVSMAQDDEDGRNKVAIDDMARWTRYMRFPIPGTDVIFQIPWGFGLGAFAAMAAQVVSLGVGNNSIKDTLINIKDIGFDAFLPLPASKINMWENPAAWAMDSATPSVFRPFLEYAMNLDGLGREIYNNRQSRQGDAYTGGDNIPELYKDAAKMLANITDGAVDFSPNTMYFFANNYADGLSRLVHNSYNIGLVGAGEKEFNPKTDTLLFDSFFGVKSNYDARQFSKVENQIKDMERKLNMFKDNPEKYAEYVADHPLDQGIVDIYNKGVNGDLKEVRALANSYRAQPGLTAKERKDLLENVKEQQNLIKRHLISVFEAYDIKP
jgi:hypothetical protein